MTPVQYPSRVELYQRPNGQAVLLADDAEYHYDNVNAAAVVANANFLRSEWWRADYGFTGTC